MSQQAQLRVRSGEVRSPSSEISELDKRIIEHLQQDGRRPFTQIATALRVSEATVRARTNRLIARGILQIVGVTDPLKLGFHQQAMIGVRCEASQLLEAAEVINAFPEVDYLVVTAGSYDLLVEVVCEDNEAPPLPGGQASPRGRRPGDGDIRLPADAQAGLHLGNALAIQPPFRVPEELGVPGIELMAKAETSLTGLRTGQLVPRASHREQPVLSVAGPMAEEPQHRCRV